MNWRIKGIIQKVLGILPGGGRLNDLLQGLGGELRNFEKHVRSKVEDWSILVSHMKELGVSPRGLRYMEIGTGWFPTLPVCYYLIGAGRCDTFDLTRHLKPARTREMLRLLEGALPSIAKAGALTLEDVECGYAGLREAQTIPELLQRASITYHAPGDAAHTPLPPASVDVVFSNSVLEHVPPQVIRAMMCESFRVLRPGGLGIHSVNCGDHYAYFDRRITAVNYLQYSDKKWRFWNNRLLYQNRLRPQDFLEMAEAAGLQVALRKQRARPELLAALEQLRIAPEFQHYPAEQLACPSIDFVVRKP